MTAAGRHGVDANLVLRKLDGQVMGQRMQAGFLHRVLGGWGQADRLMWPHAADVDNGAALPADDHARNDGLGQEEQCVVEFHVRVPRFVLEKRLRDEESGRVYQQCRFAVLLIKHPLQIRDRSAIRQIGCHTPRLATPAGQLSDGVVDTRLRVSDGHRTSAVVDDVDRDLLTHAGAAADNNDLLGFKMHVRVPSWF